MISISSTAIWSNQMKSPMFIDVDFWWNSWSVDVHWCPLPFPWPPYAAISSHGLLLPRPAPKAQDISGSCVVQHIWSFINAKSCTHHGLELARPNWHTRHPNLNAGEVAPCYSSAFLFTSSFGYSVSTCIYSGMYSFVSFGCLQIWGPETKFCLKSFQIRDVLAYNCTLI